MTFPRPFFFKLQTSLVALAAVVSFAGLADAQGRGQGQGQGQNRDPLNPSVAAWAQSGRPDMVDVLSLIHI